MLICESAIKTAVSVKKWGFVFQGNYGKRYSECWGWWTFPHHMERCGMNVDENVSEQRAEN